MSDTALTVEEIEYLFTQSDGKFKFARWARPIVPVVFGVDDTTLTHLKSAIATTVGLTGGKIEETDPELGANFMWFFCKEWDEILTVPDLEKLLPNLQQVIAHLQSNNGNTYRSYSFDDQGGIKLCILMVRMKDEVADVPVNILGTGETFQCLSLFAPDAFLSQSPIAVLKENNLCIAKPNFAALIRAAYDPVLPAFADDPSHALRLAARANLFVEDMKE